MVKKCKYISRIKRRKIEENEENESEKNVDEQQSNRQWREVTTETISRHHRFRLPYNTIQREDKLP
nr:hypothetical protein Itr_chr04CG04110 [Ipomoea trifida]